MTFDEFYAIWSNDNPNALPVRRETLRQFFLAGQTTGGVLVLDRLAGVAAEYPTPEVVKVVRGVVEYARVRLAER